MRSTSNGRTRKGDSKVVVDIKGFFDNIDHELLMKAVRKHAREPWIILYITRWLTAPVQLPSGQLEKRDKGTPQGGVMSSLLANLYLHYAFDLWMNRNYPSVPFERYADDIVVHLKDEASAKRLLEHLKQRLAECRLELHPREILSIGSVSRIDADKSASSEMAG
jgi:retron-type reverse transcriptase